MKPVRTTDRTDAPPTRGQRIALILFGLAFVAAGGFVEWLTFAQPADKMPAPAWVTGFAGLIFIVPGLGFVVAGLRALLDIRGDAETNRIYRGVFMATMLWLFAIAFGGAAFFGESSAFSGGISGSSIESRIVFGIAAVAIGVFALMFSVVVLGAIMARNQKCRANPPSETDSVSRG